MTNNLLRRYSFGIFNRVITNIISDDKIYEQQTVKKYLTLMSYGTSSNVEIVPN